MGVLEKILEGVAELQYKHALLILIVFLIFTIFMLFGAVKIRMESDINKEMPQQLPIYQLNDKIKDSFGGQDSIILLFSLDNKNNYKKAPKDIRDPEVINYIIKFHNELKNENSIDNVLSIASYLPSNYNFKSIEEVKFLLNQNPQLNMFFSKDYKDMMMFIESDVGSSEEKVKALNELIDQKIKDMSLPAGVKVMKTGTPPMRITVFEMLGRDALYTLTLAAIIILFLLFITEGSFTKGMLAFLPLTFGLIWTAGTMGWLGIKLSIATVGLGAMLLGLGVEYGVFMLTRYKEERKKGNNQENALKKAVPSVGSAMLGSGGTTIVGFLALTLSIMPMMKHLGISLAIGIFYSLMAAVLLAPIIIVLEERFEFWYSHRNYERAKIKKESLRGNEL